MRKIADVERIRNFMRALGPEAESPTRLYFTGGATAVLLGWRSTTIDVDIRIFPESDRLLRAISTLKESLEINVELASPADFIPALPDWENRSIFICQEGELSYFHYDLYAQALAKLERAHTQDLWDIREMMRSNRIDPQRALQLFSQIEPQLYLYPALDPVSFRRSVERLPELAKT
jgi:hypothetical protein